MSRNIFDDSRDRTLADSLRDAVPQPPADEVDWNRLHARITAAAEPHFGAAATAGAPAGSSTPAWWQPLAGWSPRGIPLAAAATVLLMLGAGALGTAPRNAAPAPYGATTFRTVEEELVNGVALGSRTLLTGLETDAMLDAVLFDDGEDW